MATAEAATIEADAKVINSSQSTNISEEKIKSLLDKLSSIEITNVPDEQEPPSLFNINGVEVLPKDAVGIIAALKKSLPAGIISGVAVDGISEQNIVERNSVIAIDVDAKDNPALYDWQAVKAAVSNSPYVAYAGLSVSGLGIFVLFPIDDATKHKQHFDAIVSDFANTTFTIMQNEDTEPTILHGIRLDPAPSNIASKRFVSYDPLPYWNTEAHIYTKTYEPMKLYVRKYTSYNKGKHFDVEAFLKAHGIAYNERNRHGGVQYIVTCPWANQHSSRNKAESAVFVYPDGKPGYKCMHGHCADKHWQQFREFYEPDAYHKRDAQSFPRLSDIDIHSLI